MIRISKVTMTMRELDRFKCIQGLIDGQLKQHVGADLETEGQRITADEFVDAVRSDGVVELAGAVVADGSEQGAFGGGGVTGVVQVVVQ